MSTVLNEGWRIGAEMNIYTDQQHEALSRIADFDHVFGVTEDGNVYDNVTGDDPRAPRIPAGIYVPKALDMDPNATELDGWQLPLSGLTGQYGYSGPWLDDSELIAGGVAERVLAMPGYWVAIYAQWSCDDDCEDGCEEPHIEGWTLAYKPFRA